MRLDYAALAPDATKAMFSVGAAIGNSSLDPGLRELVSVLISLCNRCDHCIRIHRDKALAAAVPEATLDALAPWLDAGGAGGPFTPREHAALALAHASTRDISEGISDALWEAVAEHFSPEELAHLLYQISLMNAWNRLSVTLQL